MQATLTIDLASIKRNWLILDSLSSKSVETSAVIKANAFGLGVKAVAPCLWQVGTRSFFVSSIEEAIELRDLLPKAASIFALNGFFKTHWLEIQHYRIIPVINSPEQLIDFNKLSTNEIAALQIDIGMNRLGFTPIQIEKYLEYLKKSNIRILIGHLSSADQKTAPENNEQHLKFSKIANQFKNIKKSISATSGIILGSRYHFDMTRPGIGLFGGIRDQKFSQVIQIDLPILQVKEAFVGDGVGYNLTHKLKKNAKLATVSAGYADGLVRALSNKGKLFYQEIKCPIVGRVSMDLITVDISNLKTVPRSLSLINSRQSLIDLACDAGTIPYEMLTQLGSRYKRVYTM